MGLVNVSYDYRMYVKINPTLNLSLKIEVVFGGKENNLVRTTNSGHRLLNHDRLPIRPY